jgi:hypothetical protein
MKIYEETHISKFKFWGQAETNVKSWAFNESEWESLEQFFEDCYPDGIEDEVLNDTLSFDLEFIELTTGKYVFTEPEKEEEEE